MKVYRMLSVILLLMTLSSFAQSAWKIQSIGLKPKDEITRTLTAQVQNSKGDSLWIETPVVLTKITDKTVFGGKLALIGDAGKAQAVVILDLTSRKVIDWFYCYFPQRISRSLIALVEWYPSSSPTQIDDVVMIYDLRKSPKDNRLPIVQHEVIPAAPTEAPVRVGVPVYPPSVAEAGTYTRPETETPVQVMAHTFSMLPNRRLAFAIAKGSDLQTAQTSLVVVDLSGSGTKSPVKLDVPTTSLKRTGENPNYVLVERIAPVSPDRVRLYVSRKSYGVSYLFVDIPHATSANKTQ